MYKVLKEQKRKATKWFMKISSVKAEEFNWLFIPFFLGVCALERKKAL